MTHSLDLALHHVGGRGGSRRFPVLPSFEGDMVNVLYDGDPDCLDGMAAASDRLASRTIALADCIGQAAGPAFLRLYRDCGASSLLAFREDYKSRFLALGSEVIDHQASAFDTIRSVPVQLATLDQVLARPGAAVPPPDFLSLNTQGSELQIMLGAGRTLREHALVLQAEVSLFEIYEGQASLDGILREAERQGFLATRVAQLGAWVPSFTLAGQPVRPPLGMRLGGMALQVDVELFKAPAAILAQHAEPQLDLVKAVFLAVALKNYSLSFAYGSQVDRGFLAALPRGRKAYLDFVADYLAAVDRQPSFPAIDFIVTDDAIGPRPEGLEAIRRTYFEAADRERFRVHAGRLLAPEPTELEAVCSRHGLARSAALLRDSRLAGMRGVCRLLGVLAADGETLDAAAFADL